jgi:glyoxylase-like metal-dependent hydrolase (beta-lactamase superfamily II)
MFGVVPKTLWSRRIPPDERNRIPLALRCLLIEHPDGPVLVDTGLGNKEDARFVEIYGVENRGAPGPTLIEDALAELGLVPADIRQVINTHLHFDHAGGTTPRPGRDRGSPIRLTYPNARYAVQRGDLEFARHANERTRELSRPQFRSPWPPAGSRSSRAMARSCRRFRRLTRVTCRSHQSIVVQDGGETAVFLGDLIPTAAHLRRRGSWATTWKPLRTLESRRALLRDAVGGGWRLVFEHDAGIAWGRASEDGKDVVLADVQPAAARSA